jgi:Carboxypeptidase regulatory-like domain
VGDTPERGGCGRLLTRLAIVVGGITLVTSGIAMAASGSGGARPLTNRDAVYGGGASISGTVKDAQGNPITTEDICVQAFEPTAYNGWIYSNSAVTNASGQYTITGLRSGSYKVAFVDCDQSEPYDSQFDASTRDDVPQYYSDTTDWESASLVVLSEDGAKSGIDAELAAGTSISGHVYTSSDDSVPKQSECVTPQLASGGFPGSGPLEDYYYDEYYGESGSDGSYRLQHLEPSIGYVVEFYDCAYPKTYLTQFDGDASEPQTATVLTPTLADPVTEVDAHLIVGGKISGSVTDSKKNPITTSDICMYAERVYEPGVTDAHPYDDYGYATTEQAGDYAIGGLSAGKYDVHFEDCDSDFSTRNDLSQYYNNQSNSSTATPVEVTLGADHTGVDASLAPGASISGHVYGSLGTSKPLEDVCVYAYSASESSEFLAEVSSTFTEVDGSYTVKHLPPGAGYKIEFIDCENQSYTSRYYDEAATLADARVLTPTLTEPITGIDAHLVGDTPETEITGGPANSAATNATTASFSFTSTIAGATFECALDAAAFAPCTSPFSTGALTTGKHTFTVRATTNGKTDANPPTVTWTVSPSSPTSTSQGSVPAGGTVSSNPGAAASQSNPVVAEATLPDAGTVTMTKEPATTPSANGYTVFGQQLDIAATEPGGVTPLAGTATNPITLTFEIDGSAIPAGTELSAVTVLRNGVPAANCTGTAGTASPDPCVESRTPTADGGVKLTVLTTHCSLWNFATTSPAPPSGGHPGGTGSTGEPGTGDLGPSGMGVGTAKGGVLDERFAAGAPSVGHVSVRGTAANVPLRCNGTSGATCKLTITLAVTETVRDGSLVTVSAASALQRHKVVTVGEATVILQAGKSKTVEVALNSTGRQLLAKRHTLKVKLTVAVPGAAKASAVAGYTLTFKAGRGRHTH